MAARNPESDSEDYDEEELRDELERGFDELQGANVDEDRDSEGTKPLSTGLSRSYVYLWRGAHAFREFYQNWVDAIKESNNLGDIVLNTKLEDKKAAWLFKALHPFTGELLGFIRFMKSSGLVELTNFGAHLSRKTLDLGYSSKRRNANLAGCHGEGYKVASLVMVREGYRIKIATSNRYWSFRFGGRDKRHLWCYFSKSKEKFQERVKKQKKAYEARVATGKPREAKANIWEDVTITIGGGGTKVNTVSQNDFLEWIQHCIDLDPPSSMIKTKLGDLILDPKFANKMFLKGLLLEGNSKSRQWKFGYNLAQGEVNRDRQQVSDPEEQGEVIAGIWNEACQKEKAATLLPYLDMLRAETQYPDVSYAEENMSEAMAKCIWEQLLEEDQERKLFYYYIEKGHQDIALIKKSLKKDAKSLPRAIWNPLRKYNLVRTVEEQRHHLLHNAPQSAAPSTPYSKGFNRTLKAVFSLDPRTKDLELDFRSGAEAELDLLLEGSKLLINNRWLDFLTSHQVAPCSLFTEATANNLAIECFSCGHIVADLYELLLVELSKSPSTTDNNQSEVNDSSLRLKVSESIEQMPCKVGVTPGAQSRELVVSWVHTESEKANRLHGLDLKGRVILHQMSTCAARVSELLSSEPHEIDNPLQNVQPRLKTDCGCPKKVVSLKDSSVTFHDLDHTQEYFPMVSRTVPQSFFASPPSAVLPKPPQITCLTLDPAVTPLELSTQVTPNNLNPSAHEGNRNYGLSGHDDDDDHMETDTPIGRPSTQIPNNGPQNISGSRVSPLKPLSTSPNTLTVSERGLDVSHSKKEIEDQRKRLIDQHSKLINYADEIEDLHMQLTVKEDKLQAANKQKSDVAGIVAALQVQIAALRIKCNALLRDGNAKGILVTHEQDKNKFQQQLLQSMQSKLQKATAEVPRWTKQLEEAAAQQGAMKERLKTLEQELRTTKEAVQAANTSVERLQKNDQDASLVIDQLRANIQQLQDANSGLEADLDTYQDINAKQAQLALNRATRMRGWSAGVKREIKEEDDGASRTPTKRPKLGNVITTQVEGAVVID